MSSGFDELGYSRVSYAVGDEGDVASAHVAEDISEESMAAVKRVSEAAWQLLRDTEDDRMLANHIDDVDDYISPEDA